MVVFSLTAEQKTLRNNARAFAQNVLSSAPSLYSHLTTQTKRFRATLPIYQAAVSAGLIKGQIPVPLGGGSTGLIDAAIVVEEFHAVEPSTAITILGTGLGLMPLILAGSKEQHKEFLKPFLEQKGQPIASFVHSEPAGTANWLEKGAPGLQTTAWRDGDEWVVDGEKLWATNSSGFDAQGADLQCLLAGHTSANGPHARFKAFRVPNLNLLAEPGKAAQVVEQTFGMSAAIVGAMCVGVMRHAFETALAFTKSDTRGGTVKLLERQSVADRLMDVKMRIEAARALTWKAMCVLESTDEGVGWEQRLELALEAKIWCSEEAPKAILKCMDVVGMKSYAKDMPFSTLLADAACLPLFDGGNVGVRRRQLEKILQTDEYEPWGATYGV